MDVNDLRDWIANAGTPGGLAELSPQAWGKPKVSKAHTKFAHGANLPYSSADVNPWVKHLGIAWWRRTLDQPAGEPGLSFPMLNRLASFLLRENPKILAALQCSFSYVFLDEFQDTTEPQYDLISTSFLGTDTVVTAVGDSKQRIMLWAGAMSNTFERFIGDYGATHRELIMNHRSSPALVSVLGAIADAVEQGTPASQPTQSTAGGSCEVLEYMDHKQEAADLARMISNDIESGSLKPSDFCVLVKQQAKNIIGPLQSELRRGVSPCVTRPSCRTFLPSQQSN